MRNLGRTSILIVCPAPPRSKSGNRVRALRYQSILRDLGAKVRIESRICGRYDIAIIINAVKSAAAVQDSGTMHPERPMVVVVSGTDLYRFGHTAAFHRSLRDAQRIVVSQPAMVEDLPAEYRNKCVVIFQSAKDPSLPRSATPRNRSVIVCGHLRREKDPFRAALAVRQLPAESRIEVHHYGAAMEEHWAKRAKAEMSRNARYRWHGEVRRTTVRRKLATAWLMVLSSRIEGGANVLSEAIAAGTPLLATRIPGTQGLLGQDYAGYFEVGSTDQLRSLLLKCESDLGFYRRLTQGVARRSALVDPRTERKAWRDLLRQL